MDHILFANKSRFDIILISNFHNYYIHNTANQLKYNIKDYKLIRKQIRTEVKKGRLKDSKYIYIYISCDRVQNF